MGQDYIIGQDMAEVKRRLDSIEKALTDTVIVVAHNLKNKVLSEPPKEDEVKN